MRQKRLALAALVCGLVVVVAAQRLAPIAGPPLYDGVVVADEYKWLSPPPGYAGGAQSAADSGAVQGGQSPNLAVGTSEQPPQAQVFAGQGFLSMPPGTLSISVSIAPVQPATQPAGGVIAGNVYRFSLTSQSGGAISGQASGGVTIILRGPASLPTATIERLDGGTWNPLPTDPAGVPDMFTAVVTDFGDFALIAPPGWVPVKAGRTAPVNAGPAAPGSAASPSPAGSSGGPAESGPPILVIAAVALALVILLVAGVLFWLRRRPAGPVPPRRSPPPPPYKRSARAPQKRPTRRR
jgi:hypothetical protein